ncbi:MAG: protein-L-isoaspartate(D-aspartate) O-methyltransferase [candidate division Zixibacteria bacterium]|nr:protein-L-isoaspartate(D-aspartate) O-methyltransferase [candidate division Zixibacteria bacterium]
MRSISEEIFEQRRQKMVTQQIKKRGVTDSAVLQAMSKLPRHLFVPERFIDDAYEDGPLSIGEGQTISQPYVVASMTSHLHLSNESRVLEIGTGSGYQTAILAEIAKAVYTIERIGELIPKAERLFELLGYDNIFTKHADGSNGWPEAAPFDAIIVTAAAKYIPEILTLQLNTDGIMIIPLDRDEIDKQELVKVKKSADGLKQETLYPVRFVPLLGDIET